MALRVVLVSAAILPVPQVMAGRMTLSQPEAPEAGNHFSCTENRMINSSPIQKFGMAKPIKKMWTQTYPTRYFSLPPQ